MGREPLYYYSKANKENNPESTLGDKWPPSNSRLPILITSPSTSVMQWTWKFIHSIIIFRRSPYHLSIIHVTLSRLPLFTMTSLKKKSLRTPSAPQLPLLWLSRGGSNYINLWLCQSFVRKFLPAQLCSWNCQFLLAHWRHTYTLNTQIDSRLHILPRHPELCPFPHGCICTYKCPTCMQTQSPHIFMHVFYK